MFSYVVDATQVLALDPAQFLRHTFCTRLLLAVVPSTMYFQEFTVQTLLGAIVEDLLMLSEQGIDVTSIFFCKSFHPYYIYIQFNRVWSVYCS